MTAVNLDVERAFVGALLALNHNGVAELADVVCGPDFCDPNLRDIYAAIVDVAKRGVDPLPVAVMAHMVVTGYGEANQRQILGNTLARLYLEAPPAVGAPDYAELVLAQAYRRALTEMCERLAQAASESSLADVGPLQLAETERVMAVWSRVPAKARATA